MLSRHSMATDHENELIPKTLYDDLCPYVTRQGTLGHNRLSSLNHCGLILALKRSVFGVRDLIST